MERSIEVSVALIDRMSRTGAAYQATRPAFVITWILLAVLSAVGGIAWQQPLLLLVALSCGVVPIAPQRQLRRRLRRKLLRRLPLGSRMSVRYDPGSLTVSDVATSVTVYSPVKITTRRFKDVVLVRVVQRAQPVLNLLLPPEVYSEEGMRLVSEGQPAVPQDR